MKDGIMVTFDPFFGGLWQAVKLSGNLSDTSVLKKDLLGGPTLSGYIVTS